MKWSDIPEDQWASHQKYVEDRWQDLSSHAHTWSKESLKILFLTNAGGAVAILTFIGTASTVRAEDWPWIMLGFFCVGIILLQLFHGALYYKIEWMWESYRRDVAALFSDQKDWEAVQADDDKRSDRFVWLDILPISAGICFIVAVIIGFSNFQSLIEKERRNGEISTIKPTGYTSTPSPAGGAEKQSSAYTTPTSSAKEEMITSPLQRGIDKET